MLLSQKIKAVLEETTFHLEASSTSVKGLQAKINFHHAHQTG
jgi:hypothetical protein